MANTLIAGCTSSFAKPTSVTTPVCFIFRRKKIAPNRQTSSRPNLRSMTAVLKKIIRRLYYPDSPYEFSVLPADILGQVYEQFLGKVIRLTEGHQAKVEDKPEVKKAGGVYYTPTCIVDYIRRQKNAPQNHLAI